ncbi:PrsW family glutamic-type intramembrane protease [Gracilinema caldarium]|uniref:PrsW family glutamic-type intramembrane protease n=1 Tax=Gracilinema caldarium TaxID=215591 RepID=UPI0026ECD5EF|nr:PrsW family glutamic-type intramembrane protease [Gracilinema caldarium]
MVLVVGISALPVIVLFFYLKKRVPQFGNWLFIAALAAGSLSMLLASLLQITLPAANAGTFLALIYTVFIRNAMTEELGRLLVLILLFWILPVFYQFDEHEMSEEQRLLPLYIVVFIGITAGFSFAMLETISYGMLNLQLVIVRTLTSAPLHAACAARVSVAAWLIFKGGEAQRGKMVKAVFYGISAVLIHGIYNLLLLFPSSFAVLPVILAYIALASALTLAKTKDIRPLD